jgi:hypothetical protein
MDKQIIEAEKAFKQKMEELCNETVRIIETNIKLQPSSSDE